ncbi:MAG: hypothetical protein EOM91_22235 [Sphingobacteriia bacterium]|nr:hypothetical protein [Sphingobacteriia bacterium]
MSNHFPVRGAVKKLDQIQKNVALEVTWNPEAGRYDNRDRRFITSTPAVNPTCQPAVVRAGELR